MISEGIHRSAGSLLSPLPKGTTAAVSPPSSKKPASKPLVFDLNFIAVASKKILDSPLPHVVATATPSEKPLATVLDLKDMASSRRESLMRHVNVCHAEVLKDFNATHTRISKRLEATHYFYTWRHDALTKFLLFCSYRTNYFIMIIFILGIGFLRKPLAMVAAILTRLSIAFLNDRPVLRGWLSAKRAIHIGGRPRWVFVGIFFAAEGAENGLEFTIIFLVHAPSQYQPIPQMQASVTPAGQLWVVLWTQIAPSVIPMMQPAPPSSVAIATILLF